MDSLADFQLAIMDFVNAKFVALRRMAELLEALGDFSAFFPDLSRLIALSSIDLSLYDDLQAGCPQLNLPPSGGVDGPVTKLQAEVGTAYGKLVGDLQNSPWIRMDRLQAEFDSAQSEFNQAMLSGNDYLSCLSTICGSFQSAGALVSKASKMTPAATAKVVKDYATNVVANEGKILSKAAKQKADDTKEIIAGIANLRDVADLPSLPSFSS